MKFEVYNQNSSNLKVAFFCKNTFGMTLSSGENVQKLAEYNNLEIHLLDVDFLDSGFSIRGSYEDHKLFDTNPKMTKLYDFVQEYIEKNNIKIAIFFGSGYPWTKAFLERLKKYSYVACYFGDDPEGADGTSRYYVSSYHYAFCGGIYFDKKTLTKDKYLKWGARKSIFIPLGVNPDKYADPVRDFNNRSIDLVYIGGAYRPKILRMFRLKRHFKGRMKLYGVGWNGYGGNFIKGLLIKVVKFFYNVPQIEELPKNKLVDLYQNAKIGFNMHMSYGPSNLRMYELPMNGVMQICDCENGLKELYEIGKEVVAYKNLNEAIKKIEYYLKNDEERIKIAKAGYERAKNNYRLEQSFEKIFDEIKKDIRDNFHEIYKII